MTRNRRVAVLGAVVVALSLGATSAWAGAWTTSSGNADGFSYSGGGDLNGLFGDPFVFGGSFFFTQSDFHVQSVDGGPTTLPEAQSDTMSVDVLADAGLTFSLIRVTAHGSYAVTEGGASADIDAGLAISENGTVFPNPGPRSWNGPLVTQPVFPVSTADSGTWNGLSTVDISFILPAPHSSLNLSLSNDLLTISTVGSSAEINMTFEDIEIQLEVIPEPATFGLMAMGGLALLRRRR
ncbi:MAG: PEP-CTERM sorting domain-containing protein [bacterium]|nr:PEP-CTERM sorting domain-containing protein [bacterium]